MNVALPQVSPAVAIALLAVLAAACFAVLRVARLLGIPVMIALVIAGLATESILPANLHVSIGPGVLALCLPALIFEAAWNCDIAIMRTVALQVAILAVPGVFITTAVFAGAAVATNGMAWPAALVLGAIVSATDPVAVLAIFKNLGLPPALTNIVEGESVANDGVAVVLVSSLAGFAATGALKGGVLGTAAFMIYESVAGILVGIAIALLGAYLMRARIRTAGRVAVSIGVAYASYFLADQVHGSGIFAVAAAGILLRARAPVAARSADEKTIDGAWHALAFVANVTLFVLVGLSIRLDYVFGEPLLFAACAAAAVVARALLAYVLVPRRGLTDRPLAWRNALALSGLRGGLSLALALDLPEMPSRELVIDAVFAVVFLTLVVQGSAVAPLIRRLGLGGPEPARVEGA